MGKDTGDQVVPIAIAVLSASACGGRVRHSIEPVNGPSPTTNSSAAIREAVPRLAARHCGRRSGANAPTGCPRVCYVLHQFPVLSQTFVWNEIFAVEAAGAQVDVTYLHYTGEEVTDDRVQSVLSRATHLGRWLGMRERWSNRARVAMAHLARCHSQELAAHRDYHHARALAERLAALVLKARACHLHAHFAGEASRIAMVAASMVGVSFSFTMHGHDIYFAPPDDLRYQAVRAKVIVTASEANRAYLVEHLRLPASKVVVVRNGIRVEDFRADRNAPVGSTVHFLTVARLHGVKGLDIMVEALAKLPEDGWSWTVVGDGPERAALEAQCRSLRIIDRVRFLGACSHEDLPQVYEAADVFVLPSRSEGLGVVLIEAMASGLPFVASRVGGICEIAALGTGAYLFDTCDAANLATVLRRFIEVPELARALGAGNREIALREFSIEQQGQAILRAWDL